MRRSRQDLGFVALKIEGGILPAEFLQKVVALEAKNQSASDYKLPKGPTIKDEIGRAWRIANAEWTDYKKNRERTDLKASSVGIDQWLAILFKTVLGHTDMMITASPLVRDDRSFRITHLSTNGHVPFVLTTDVHNLQKPEALFGEEGRKRSAHALMQEFLNASEECLWGIVSNGNIARLLRDNPSLTRPSYVEADLERIFEEQLYPDFAALWLIFHGSRFEVEDHNRAETCIMEQWRQEGHETGERALANLRDGVTTALREFGNGFLENSSNGQLLQSLQSGALSPSDFFRQMLRLVYRFLFLFTVEERELLHGLDVAEETKNLYSKGYSINRLKNHALSRRNYDAHTDLWESLKVVFRCLSQGSDALGLPALGGLFSVEQCFSLDASKISNARLLRALYALSFFRNGDILARINYRDMDTEELGSVYESLLELHPLLDVDATPWTFGFAGESGDKKNRGSERKLSGSYYTPASLVNELVRTALEPVIEKAKTDYKEDPRGQLLKLKIVDPACGSGHFLLAAARRLATEIAILDAGGDVAEEDLRRHALREVIRHCIYGVDRNPLAVELCKTAMWIESMEVGKPLSFLDSHIRCGNSLIGVLRPSELRDGIPDEAYTPLAGDDEKIARELRKRNRAAIAGSVQGNVFTQTTLERVSTFRTTLETMPEDTLEQIEEKRKAFGRAQEDSNKLREEYKSDIFVAAFFAPKLGGKIDDVPTSEDLDRLVSNLKARPGIEEKVRDLANKHGFLHWHTTFPEVFVSGGFDVIVGNPPWEHTELKEKEWFAVRRPDIATALTGANRKTMIKKLQHDEPRLFAEFTDELRQTEAVSLFVRNAARYPLCGRGRINTYAIFAETMRLLLSEKGRLGCIVPSGIATDDTTKLFFRDISERGQLVSLYDFENREGIFPDVDSRMKFCLMTLRGSKAEIPTDFAAFVHSAAELLDSGKHYALSAEELSLLNPNTCTLPMFRSKRDAVITKDIYRRLPIFFREIPQEENSWGVWFRQGFFNTTSDSHLFHGRAELEDAGWTLDGNVFYKNGLTALPFYEAKMIAHYDHRSSQVVISKTATIRQGQPQNLSLEDHQSPTCMPLPRYWVFSEEVARVIPEGYNGNWFIGFSKVTSPTNHRTTIGTILPRAAVADSLPVILFPESTPGALVASFLAVWCSFLLDYVCRQKIGGVNLNFFIVKQLPVLTPQLLSGACDWDHELKIYEWLTPRVLELVYTSWDVRQFALDCGYDGAPFRWEPERRFLLRCEIDASMFHLYGVNRDDIEHVMNSFPIVRQNEEKQFGRFRTLEQILICFEQIAAAKNSGIRYKTAIEPEPGNKLASH